MNGEQGRWEDEIRERAYLCGYEQGKRECKRPTGKWKYNQYDGNANIGNWHCSECRCFVYGGYNQKPYYNFCPNCGADMKGENNDNTPLLPSWGTDGGR